MLVRFISAALMGWTLVEFLLYWVISNHNQQPLETMPCVMKSLPFLTGVIMLIKSRALAAWISDKLDL